MLFCSLVVVVLDRLLYFLFYLFFIFVLCCFAFFFFFQAEDGIRDATVTGVQTCALPILSALALGLLSFLWLACSRAADRHPRGFRRAPQTNARAAPAARGSSGLALGFHLRWGFSSLRRRSRSLGLSGVAALAAGDLGVDALGEVERAVPAARAEEVIAGRGLDQHRHAAARPDGDAHQRQLHLDQRVAPRDQTAAIGTAGPPDQLDHQVDLALLVR